VWTPKPDLMPLTGGYRKTPLMQVGADLYCDTQLIMLELERRLPSPPFLLKGREGEARAITTWIDRNMFAPAVGLVMSQIDVAGKFGAGFARDRSDFSGRNFDPERLRAVLPVVRDQAYGQLSLAEAMLADGRRFVLGAEPSMPDCALYNPVWFNRRAAHVRLPPKDLTDLLHARNRRHCATSGLMHRSILRPVSSDLVSRLLVRPFGQRPTATRLNKIPDLHGSASVRRLEPDPA
jgi:glutathione S-transferase